MTTKQPGHSALREAGFSLGMLHVPAAISGSLGADFPVYSTETGSNLVARIDERRGNNLDHFGRPAPFSFLQVGFLTGVERVPELLQGCTLTDTPAEPGVNRMSRVSWYSGSPLDVERLIDFPPTLEGIYRKPLPRPEKLADFEGFWALPDTNPHRRRLLVVRGRLGWLWDFPRHPFTREQIDRSLLGSDPNFRDVPIKGGLPTTVVCRVFVKMPRPVYFSPLSGFAWYGDHARDVLAGEKLL